MKVIDRRTHAANSVLAALEVALHDVTLKDADSATVVLARKYAETIDADPAAYLPKIGHHLADLLAELGMTPRARAGVVRGATPSGTPSSLDELRDRRERREQASIT